MFGNRGVYCGIDKVDEALPHLVELKLGIEVVFDSTANLWPQIRWENLLQLADRLKKANIAATIHGPFHGINLGSRDAHLREYSESVLTACVEVCESFDSPLMVFHTGFLPQLAPRSREKWMKYFIPGLERVLEHAHKHGILPAMENTYEEDTDLFQEIFERVPHPLLRMCLDTGHAACFGKVNPSEWARRFTDRICHLHLSDNDGRADLHWSLGEGVVDFREQLRPLARSPHIVSITYEVSGPNAKDSDKYFLELMNKLDKEAAS